MSHLERVVKLSVSLMSRAYIGIDVNNKFFVSAEGVDYKNDINDCMIRGLTGRGSTIEEAALDFLVNCRGKILVKDYDEKRLTVVVI